MDDTDELAPAVASILDAARARPGVVDRLGVEARSLVTALADARDAGRVPIIAEIKPTSPTTNGARTVDPVELAQDMITGGAAALSVLTESAHFGGSPDALRAVREAVDVPVLRKDFILTEDQLDVVPADVVLLIARFLDTDGAASLGDLVRAARDRGFQVLVEVHTTAELQRAVEAGADIVGVNNRDLARLAVDLGTFERVAPAAPADITLIAESGIATPADVRRMCRAGADGLLVGSAIMAGDPVETTRRLATATPEDPST